MIHLDGIHVTGWVQKESLSHRRYCQGIMNESPKRSAKVLSIVIVFVVIILVAVVSELFASFATGNFAKDTLETYPWIYLCFHHFMQMVVAIALMLVTGAGLKHYGFELKSKNLYLIPAVIVGVLFGVIMTLVDHGPALITGNQIEGYTLDATNVAGWLSFEWLLAGTSEEIFVRGLLMTYLMTKFSGHVRFIRWDVHVAGVIIAVLFALMHIGSFWSGNLIYAIGQQIYAFILGLCYAYFYEKSGSLVAPIVAHNLSNGIEFVLLFILLAAGF